MHFKFYEFCFKIIGLGFAAFAILYHILKSEMEQDDESKLMQKKLKDKEKLIVEKQKAIDKADVKIQITEEELKQRKKWWFF